MTSVAPRPLICWSLATSVSDVDLFELGEKLVGDLRELDGVGVFDGVLILRARDAVFDGEVLRGLQEGLDAGDLVELALQAAG